MKSLRRKLAVLLGGPDCGKQIRTEFTTLLLKDGTSYVATNERDKSGRLIYRHEREEVSK